MDKNEIKEVLMPLADLKNPEDFHKQAHMHPGENYYLCTIIPDPNFSELDREGYAKQWLNIFQKNNLSVKIVKTAFDWSGFLIPKTWSIFLEKDLDYIVEDKQIKLISKTLGDYFYFNLWNKVSSSLKEDDEQNFAAIMSFSALKITKKYKKEHYENERKKWKIIDGDEDGHGIS